ncbi:MAG: GMC family oxidoreductase [Cyanobacteria bacterium P01_A01_bin.84]
MINYDIIIIGTGAGGGTLAYSLAATGKKILILERGDYIPKEKENWDTEAVFIKGKYKTKETWYDKDNKTFHPGIHYCVGGNTKVYGAALLRMREEDFNELKHHGGTSPEWPISYDDLEPYYTQAEHMYHVHGKHGIDPCSPPVSEDYTLASLPHESRIEELKTDMEKLGLKPFPLPIGVKFNDAKKGESPTVLDRFDGFPDPSESKADSHVVCIKEALKYDNVTLVTNAKVTKLLTCKNGQRVTKVEVEQFGKARSFSGDLIIVACGAINSAVLLLNSKNNNHPNGLANSSDLVGRNYMAHNNSALLAISKKPNPTIFGKTLGLNDFYFGDDDFQFPMGHIQMLGKSDAVMFKADAPKLAPGMALEYIAKHALDFWMTSEDLPDPENRVLVDDMGNITLKYKENNLEGHNRLQKKLKWILENVGCETHVLPNNMYLGKKIPIAGTAHQCGTLRFGNNPKTSVLDTYCKAHDLENLYVVDGSFFPSSSAVNPALTIIAQALRVGEHLKKNVLAI